MFWQKLFFILLSAFLIWTLIIYYRKAPQMFSKENFSKSLFSMGILALLLIGIISINIFWLRYQH